MGVAVVWDPDLPQWLVRASRGNFEGRGVDAIDYLARNGETSPACVIVNECIALVTPT